jgi:hypothetical protein
MRRPFLAVLVSSVAVLGLACSAPPDAPEDGAAESLGETQEALQTAVNPSGLGGVCRACGCSWVSRVIDGCTQFRCECPSEAKAWCVVRAPSGVALSPGDVVVPSRTGAIAAPVSATLSP